MIRRGLIFCSCSGASPHFSITPGRKFSISTSVSEISRRRMSCPAGLLKLSVIVRLLRAMTLYHKPCPSWFQPWVRAGSPCGCSILITSAPKSPNSIPVIGAAYTVLTSNTRVPVNGGFDPLRSPSPAVVGPATSSLSAPSASDVIPPSVSGNLLETKTIHQFFLLSPGDPCASNEEEGESEDDVDGE